MKITMFSRQIVPHIQFNEMLITACSVYALFNGIRRVSRTGIAFVLIWSDLIDGRLFQVGLVSLSFVLYLASMTQYLFLATHRRAHNVVSHVLIIPTHSIYVCINKLICYNLFVEQGKRKEIACCYLEI